MTAEVKVVPVEPTEAMIKAADAADYELRQQGFAGADVAVVWAIMLAASPPAETGEGEDEARRDAWSDFESDHLTDGKGHATAGVYLHCRFAFDAAWPQGRDGAIAAAIAALPSGWPTVKITHPASDQSDTERMRAALKGLLDHVDVTTCTHESTKRGGFIWTICEDCGAKWADDEGGFKPHVDAPAVSEARAALAEKAADQ